MCQPTTIATRQTGSSVTQSSSQQSPIPGRFTAKPDPTHRTAPHRTAPHRTAPHRTDIVVCVKEAPIRPAMLRLVA
jgi:hypothetical protein